MPRQLLAQSSLQPPAASRLLLASLLLCGVAGGVAGCSGAQAGAKPAQTTTVVATVPELERRVRAGDFKAAAALAAAMRAKGPVAPRVLALESLARWGVPDIVGARAAADELVQRAVSGDREALLATDQLAAAQIDAKRDAEAIRATEPLFAGGCASAAVCRLALRLLTAVQLTDDALLQRAEAMAPPVGRDGVRQRWLLELARTLADGGRDEAHAKLIRARLNEQPGDPVAWAALLYRAPRTRGDGVRQSWIAELRAANLPIGALRAVAAHPDIATDPVIRNVVYAMLCERADASAADWTARVTAAGQSASRGADPEARSILLGLAQTAPRHLVDAASKRALVSALLYAGLTEQVGQLLPALLADTPVHPEALVLQAEHQRQVGDLDAAKATAQAASAADPARAGEVAGMLAARWAGVWPDQARLWSEAASKASGGIDDVSLRLRVLRLLGSYQPPAGAEVELRAFGALIRRDLQRAAGEAAAKAELRDHVEKLGRLLPRGAWLGAAADALVQLCVGETAEARTCELAAEGRIRQRDREEGLRLWALARDLAPSSQIALQPQGTAAVWVHVGDARGLAAWLRLSALRTVSDLALSWRIALTLIGGGEVLVARPWLHDTLARVGGTDVLLATLSAGRADVSAPSARLRIAEAELEVVARTGGADIVLSQLDTLRKAAIARGEAGAGWRYARVEAIALATLARGDEAHRLLERIAAVTDLDDRQRLQLADLAARLHLCDVALDVATSLASNRWSETKRVLQAAVQCGQTSHDNVRLAALADRVAKAHIELSVQLEFAQYLSHGGAHLLAAAWYQRLLGPGRGPVNMGHQLEWAEVLLKLGRPGEADEVLEQILRRNRGQAVVVGARNGARLLVAFERVEAAIALLDRAIAIEDHQELALLRLECQLRIGDAAGLAASLDLRARKGLERIMLDQLLKIARATRTLPVLHQALQGLQDVDREVERFRLEVAAAVQDGAAIDGSVQRLRARGVPPSPVAVQALAAQGRWQRARTMAEELLAGGDTSGAPARDEQEALAVGIAVRRDPISVQEAVALGRLALARSSEPTVLALPAAERMVRAGAAAAAMALIGHAVEAHGDDPLVLYDAGVIALLAGRHAEALAYWQRATARILAEPNRAESRGSMEGNPREIAVIIKQLRAAGATELLRSWLPLWIDQRPHLPDLWAHWIRADIDAGEPALALERFRRADRVLNVWPEDVMRDVARSLLRAGMGPAMAALLVSADALQRNDAWWQAFTLSVVADHGQALPPGARDAFVRSARSALSATPHGRAWLARHLAERGLVNEALAALGASPFAAAHLDVLLSPVDDELAAAVAGVLVAMMRPTVVALQRGEATAPVDALATLRDAAAQGRQNAAIRQARAWLARASIADVVLVAEHLALQGHAPLAKLLIAEVLPAASPMAAQALWMMRALRVVAAGGDQAEIAAFAARCVTAPAVNGATYDLAARRREIALHLIQWGHPQAARALLTTERRVPAITSLWVPAGAEGVAFADGALARFDVQALAVVPSGSAANVASEAFRVLVARGDGAGAIQVARAAADREDEPWHLRGLFVREALRWRAFDVARELLQSARKDAPEGAYACARLALGEGSVASCVHGRPAVALDPDEFAAIADAVGRGDPAAVQLGHEITQSGELGTQARWMGALAARLGLADPAARRRGAEVATALLAGMPSGSRSRLSNVSLDELAALGVPEIAVQECQVAYQAERHDHGALNNLAYARLMAGASPAEVAPMALASLSALAGTNAHALLDTLGALALAAGDLEIALFWQRASVAAAPLDTPPSLPHVRLAEIELRLGHADIARELAAWVLFRGGAGAYVDGRARAVIQGALRAEIERAASTSANAKANLPQKAQTPTAKFGPKAANAPSTEPKGLPAP